MAAQEIFFLLPMAKYVSWIQFTVLRNHSVLHSWHLEVLTAKRCDLIFERTEILTLGRMIWNNIWAASVEQLLQRKLQVEAWLMGIQPLSQGDFSDLQLPIVHIHPVKQHILMRGITREPVFISKICMKIPNLSRRRCKIFQPISFTGIRSMGG